MLYLVLYYKKQVPGCQKQEGFSTREKALAWLQTFWDEVEWYSIEPQV